MRKYIIFSFIILITLFGQSCNDEFMDRFPKTEIGRENFFNTGEDLRMYLYSLINWPGQGIFYESSDDGYTTGNVEWRTIMTQPTSSQTITGGWSWGRLRQINFFLENFSNASLPQTELNHYEGIARFHRARFYMGMVKRFGDVPWYDKVLGTDDPDLHKPRDPREYVVERIFEDYRFAAEHVRPSSQPGDVNQWVVKAYMSRHALYEGTFRKYHDYLGLPHEELLETARDVAKDIIDNGGFSIYSTGNPDSDYASLFNNTNLVGNPEIILVNRSIDGEKNSGHSSNVVANYEQSASRDLIQAYLMNDGTFYSEQTDWETKTYVEEFENRDARLSQTFMYPGWIIYNTHTNYMPGTPGEPHVKMLMRNFTGYHQLKGFVNNQDQAYLRSVDWPVLRFAEILLIYSESRAELGELTQNDLDISINILRDRAGIPHMTMNPPVDPVQQARYPELSASTSQWPELLEIRRERRVEFARESRRYNDLLRYRAGHLLEKAPEGLYFPGLGNYDLTGDGYANIKLIPYTQSIPPFNEREVNEIGQTLVYYRAGPFGTNAVIYLKEGDHGSIQVTDNMGTFTDPRNYYRPVPYRDVQINPNLVQIFGWE